jgi:hypothetical protein
MPIHDLGPSDPSARGLDRAHDALDLSRTKRERAAAAVGDAAQGAAGKSDASGDAIQGDRVELSVAAQALSMPEDAAAVTQHSQQMSAMRAAIDAGTLADPERAARAAERLLGGS